MALSDNMRLYDIAVRKAAFVEGVKLNQIGSLNTVLAQLSDEIEDLFKRVRFKTLDGLTKAQLNKLLVELRELQGRIYTKYTETLIEDLRSFMTVGAEVSRIVYATAKVELDDDPEDEEPMDEEEALSIIEDTNEEETLVPLFGLSVATSNDKLWSATVNAPMPANGIYIVPFIKGFSVSAQANIENLIRRGYANRWTVAEVVQAITGRTVQGTGGAIQRIEAQGAAVVATAMQHVDSIVGAATASALFSRYRWISVMDSSTTEICRSRNRHIYRYGSGPLPPAHIKCRSTVAPIVGNTSESDENTFYNWIARQPLIVQAEILGAVGADRLRDGSLSADDLRRYEADRPLTLAEFRRLVRVMLTR